jgi:hypothetical protein
MAVKRRNEIRVCMSDADHARLKMLCGVLEIGVSEFVRYYIRQAYASLGERTELVGATQQALFPAVLPDGRTRIPVPIPAPPPRE